MTWFLTQDTFSGCRKFAGNFKKNRYVILGEGRLKRNGGYCGSLFVKGTEVSESVRFSRIFCSPVRSGAG